MSAPDQTNLAWIAPDLFAVVLFVEPQSFNKDDVVVDRKTSKEVPPWEVH